MQKGSISIGSLMAICMLGCMLFVKMHGGVPLLMHVMLQCMLIFVFILSISIYGAFQIRCCSAENEEYVKKIAHYDMLYKEFVKK
ncbi:hypothetical protein CWI42_091310 [Ordospora colligata]|uniref:Uncharacterized protein n=1 Tax=Ordospora colligata OC4 TaxID=1354746 RepID=A0A0B2UJQ2_9MICR|nr:uncharacterized protein M896_091330 [Ordospora colligata OC4]KHN69205.1 hypothetical protein M896_091330 [Ordospora colligata OC4]TBU14483.1 hypothetical protein CWI40_091290 [Ordospora colligata]TBU14660.1 hypothetical protein CWI41_091320 [Ordospora colligata]TBU18045.1 hypothetical protein CWI42_091310 [Ordospora colligata]